MCGVIVCAKKGYGLDSLIVCTAVAAGFLKRFSNARKQRVYLTFSSEIFHDPNRKKEIFHRAVYLSLFLAHLGLFVRFQAYTTHSHCAI